MNQEASSPDSPLATPSLLPIILLFTCPGLKVFDLLLQTMACQARETEERRATCGIFPCFPAAAAVLSETCNVCVGVSVCHAAG